MTNNNNNALSITALPGESTKGVEEKESSFPIENQAKLRQRDNMPESIADSILLNQDEDILNAFDLACTEHIRLILDWSRKLGQPVSFPAASRNSEAGQEISQQNKPDSKRPGKSETLASQHCDFRAWYEMQRHNRLIDQPAIHQLAQIDEQLHASASRVLSQHEQTGQCDPTEFELLFHRAEAFFMQLHRLERAFRAVRSDVDPLTGTFTRQTMLRDLETERECAIKTETAASIALVDVDLFKPINDQHGHQTGDRVLQILANTLQTSIRAFDRVYRYGGEEFLICLPDADIDTAISIMETMRKSVSENTVSSTDGSEISVTISVGVAPLTATHGIVDTIEKADQALYAAKNRGRNCIRAWRLSEKKKKPEAN